MSSYLTLDTRAFFFGWVVLAGIAWSAGAFAGSADDNATVTGAIPRTAEHGAPPLPGGLKTLQQIHTAMIEAEARRREATRPDPEVPAALAERWGVQIMGVTYTADGFWLDFRFRVLDPLKANALFDSTLKPYLEAEASGVRLGVPSAAKVGALRTTNRGHNIKPGKIYTIMFANPGFHVRPGQKVSVVAGDFRIEHLTVRGQIGHRFAEQLQ